MGDLYTSDYGAREGATEGYIGWRNRVRINHFVNWIDPKEGEDILEVGCNRALLLNALKEKGARVQGIDINKDVVSELNLTYVRHGDAHELSYDDGSFDKIIATEVLEHVEDPQQALREIDRVLRPGGRAYITYPIELIRGMGAMHDAIFVFGDWRYARKLHLTKFSKNVLDGFLENTSLERRLDYVRFMAWPLRFVELEKAS